MRCQCFYSAVMANSKLDYSKLLEVSIRFSVPFINAFVFSSILNKKSNLMFLDLGVTISKLHYISSFCREMDSYLIYIQFEMTNSLSCFVS